LGDVIWKAHTMGRLGMLAYVRGDYEKADSMLGEAVELHRRMGDENCAAALLAYQGLLRGTEERWVEALHYLAQSLETWDKLGISSGLILSLGRFAGALAGHGDVRAAAILYGAAAPGSHQFPQLVISERGALEELLQRELGEEYDALLTEGADLGLDEAYGRAIVIAARLTG
jgi:tetratricopeptide (TPR) repeat protein